MAFISCYDFDPTFRFRHLFPSVHLDCWAQGGMVGVTTDVQVWFEAITFMNYITPLTNKTLQAAWKDTYKVMNAMWPSPRRMYYQAHIKRDIENMLNIFRHGKINCIFNFGTWHLNGLRRLFHSFCYLTYIWIHACIWAQF